MKARKFMVMAVMIVMVSVSACGQKKSECDICGEEKVCSEVSFYGDKMNICRECYNELHDFN